MDTNAQRSRALLGAYAAYRLFNLIRHSGPMDVAGLDEAFGQYLREGALGNRQADHALDATWADSRRMRRRTAGVEAQ